MTELRPCPECGSDNLNIMTEFPSGNHVIHCMDCHKYYDQLELTREDERSDIFEKWNEYAQNYKPEPKTEPALKPCPFCGGKPVTDFERDTAHGLIGDIISWSIYCTECRAEVYSNESHEDAVRKWNRRVKE